MQHGGVVTVRAPAPVRERVVGRLRREGEREHGGNRALIREHVARAGRDVGAERLLVRVHALPLVDAVAAQIVARLLRDGEDGGQVVLRRCTADGRLCQLRAAAVAPDLIEQALLVRRRRCFLKEVRPLEQGPLQTLARAPRGDLGVVAAAQHLRHRAALPRLGAGILRVLEPAGPMALAGVALGVRQDPRHHAADAVRDDHGAELAAGEHKVADGELLVHARLDEALIHAFIVAADEHELVIVGLELAGLRLRERRPLRGEVDNAAALDGHGAVRERGVKAAFERLRHHDLAPAAAVGIVVDLLLPVFGIVADLVAADVEQAARLRPAEDALAEHGAHRVGKEGENVDAHALTSLRSGARPCARRRGRCCARTPAGRG